MIVLKRIVLAVFLLVTVHLVVNYSQDPLFWQRWWSLVVEGDSQQLGYQPVESLLGSQPSAIPVAGQTTTITESALDDAQAYARQFDSLGLLIVHRGKIQREWYRQGWSGTRLTHSQEMHQTVLALLLGVAISEGDIGSVDDPMVRYFPEWAADSRGRITIRDLLTMSSGLESYNKSLNPFSMKSYLRLLFAGDRHRLVMATVQREQPQVAFANNQINAQLLGLLLERATGQRYRDYLYEKLWLPMGGHNAKVYLDHEQGLALTTSHLLATPMDWLRIALLIKNQGWLNGQQIVPREWVAQMAAPSSLNSSYGYLLWRGPDLSVYLDQASTSTNFSAEGFKQSAPFAAADLLMLAGQGGQRVYISANHDLVVIRMTPFTWDEGLKPSWDNAYLVNTVIRGIKHDDSAN